MTDIFNRYVSFFTVPLATTKKNHTYDLVVSIKRFRHNGGADI